MIKGIYSLIAAAIVTGWGYFGGPYPVYNQRSSTEKPHEAIHKNTWACQDCQKINDLEKNRCSECGTRQGECTLKEAL